MLKLPTPSPLSGSPTLTSFVLPAPGAEENGGEYEFENDTIEIELKDES